MCNREHRTLVNMEPGKLVMFCVGLVLVQRCSAVVPRAAGHGHRTCDIITVDTCRHMPWNHTQLPNVLGHANQMVVRDSLERFESVLASGCSEDLAFVLCALHLPQCAAASETQSEAALLPCRAECQRAYENCQSELESAGVSWPSELDCSELRPFRRGGCVAPKSFQQEDSKRECCHNQKKTKKLRREVYLTKQFEYALRGTFQYVKGITGGPQVVTIHVDEVLHQTNVIIPSGTELTLWAADGCICTRLRRGHEYLFLGYKDSENRRRLLFDENSMALPWKDSWRSKLRKWDRRRNAQSSERRKSRRRNNNSPEAGADAIAYDVELRPEDRGSKKSRRRSERRRERKESSRSKRRHSTLIHERDTRETGTTWT